jgi:ATP-dependent Clp protease ATP-binding subunit ClpA
VQDHFKTEVEWYFTSRIGRAEIFNRLGDNIVVFDLLRSSHVAGIGQKFLRQLAESALDKYQLRLTFDNSVLTLLAERMEQQENLLFGGRRIKTLLETLVERPLNRWLFEHYPNLNVLLSQSLLVSLDGAGNLLVTPSAASL